MDINALKKIGVNIELDDQPFKVIYSQHARSAQGRAFVRTKLKNLITGAVLERTFNAGEKVVEADINLIKANYLYQDEEKIYLMNMENYEQLSLDKKILEGKEKLLKDGTEVKVFLFHNNPVNIELPKKIDLKVIEAPPCVRGNSATNVMKTVTLETGLKINTPLFIKQEDIVRVNTETGEYVERAK